jgi:hypothetical protein
MTQARLLTCPSCSRHVRMNESSCPFCAASLTQAVRRFVPRQPPKERLSRAALYAFGVGTLAVATACGGEVQGSSGTPIEAGQEADLTFADAYGAAPFDADYDGNANDDADYGADAAYGGSVDAYYPEDADNDGQVTSVDAYGLPPFDGGFDGDVSYDAAYGAVPHDAGEPADAGVAVPYGVPGNMH